ncbi:hypothetical protein A2U01_0116064, partial [Trifolium medium]|nr:hypothetical protein [Trifolium medium]
LMWGGLNGAGQPAYPALPVEAVLHGHRSVNSLLKFGSDLRAP